MGDRLHTLQVALTSAQGGLRSPRLGSVVGSSLVGAGRGIMPALDYLAATVIGDNPVLTAALQCAHARGNLVALPFHQPLTQCPAPVSMSNLRTTRVHCMCLHHCKLYGSDLSRRCSIRLIPDT